MTRFAISLEPGGGLTPWIAEDEHDLARRLGFILQRAAQHRRAVEIRPVDEAELARLRRLRTVTR